MKKSWLSAVLIIGLMVGGMLVAMPQDAQAFRGYGYGHHHYWHRHEPCEVLPRGFISIRLGGFSYYYSEGEYYRPCPGGYVIVPPPVGACIPSLPSAYQTVVIEGSPYYYYDGVYYRQVPNGYTVVPVGLAKSIPVKAVPVQEQTKQEEASVVMNIPNANGSYTPVTLQLAANGMYIGPQGEVYPTKPTLEQLKTMYGK